MTCEKCRSHAVVRFVLEGDREGRTGFMCASCGEKWSDCPCRVGECGKAASAVCRDCSRTLCDRHVARRKGGIACHRCRTTAAAPAGARPEAAHPRQLSWSDF